MNPREMQGHILDYIDENKEEIIEGIVEENIQSVLVRITREFKDHPLYDQIYKAVELFEYSEDMTEVFDNALKGLGNGR